MAHKFKVGDRVRSLDYNNVGEGTILSVPNEDTSLYYVKYDETPIGETCVEWEYEMELIEPNDDPGEPVEDMVNHPPHYTQYEGFEVIDIVEQLDYLRGTAVKYIMRAGSKWDEIQDLEKAIWYLQRKIDNLEAQDG